jgi:hypothetical protein
LLHRRIAASQKVPALDSPVLARGEDEGRTGRGPTSPCEARLQLCQSLFGRKASTILSSSFEGKAWTTVLIFETIIGTENLN